MAVDEHARVALGLAEREDLLADLGRLVELGAEQVQAGETAQDRELQPDVDAALEQLEGAREGGLDLRREALGRHERPRERRPQRDLLVDPLGRGRDGVEDREHVRRQPDGVEVPAVGVVEDEERLGEPVQLLEVARGDPVGPGDAQVRRRRHAKAVEGGLAPAARQVRPERGAPASA